MRRLGLDRDSLRTVHERLRSAYGAQAWWPADTRFEVMVGAVLTQNTAWRNVERAIGNLRAADRLNPADIVSSSHEQLARWLRPSGYYNVKARRLRAFCEALLAAGGEQALEAMPTAELRRFLLGIHGVGPETADDILLYAYGRPVFVVDAYTRRLFSRLGMTRGDEAYDRLRLGVERELGPNAGVFNELHALIVRHAKEVCAPRPRCAACRLRPMCPAGQTGS
ncbi:MAG: endonuclease [Gammaproteobacteria bacterium]|jgi:endonuclease-3 related protein